MTDDRSRADQQRAPHPEEDDLWAAAWPRSGSEPETERRVYRAGNVNATRLGRRGKKRRSGTGPEVGGARRRAKRSPLLAIVVLVMIAVVIALAGVAARDGGLDGSQGDAGTFKLLPLTTTTTT